MPVPRVASDLLGGGQLLASHLGVDFLNLRSETAPLADVTRNLSVRRQRRVDFIDRITHILSGLFRFHHRAHAIAQRDKEPLLISKHRVNSARAVTWAYDASAELASRIE